MEDLEKNENNKTIVTDDEDVTKYFENALIKHDEEIEKEQEEDMRPYKTHGGEYIGAILCIALAVMSLFGNFWYAAYFGLIFGGVGIYSCKKKGPYLQMWVLFLNLIPLVLCFLLGGLWLILYVAR